MQFGLIDIVMKIVLNRDINGLGRVGEIVAVKDGYGRNFLLPKGYAIVANKANVAKLQVKLEEMKARNNQMFELAKKAKDVLESSVLNMVRQAADDDTIYGSVRNRDVYNLMLEILKKNNIDFVCDLGSIKIESPIKSLGKYIVVIELFGDVIADARVNVCRAIADFESDVVAFDKKREKALLKDKDVKAGANEALKQAVKNVEGEKKSFNKKGDKSVDENKAGDSTEGVAEVDANIDDGKENSGKGDVAEASEAQDKSSEDKVKAKKSVKNSKEEGEKAKKVKTTKKDHDK